MTMRRERKNILIRGMRRSRARIERYRAEALAWNAAHPDAPPLSVRTFDVALAFLDRKASLADLERAYREETLAAAGVQTYGEREASQ